MEFRHFEREFLRLAFTTSIDLSPSSLAFVTGVPVVEAERHMQSMVSQGVLELGSNDDGHLRYLMPDRPHQPMALDGLAMVVRSVAPGVWQPRGPGAGQAVASMFLNAMVCPGVGSLVGGKTGAGLAQLCLFLVGLPLAVVTVGLPLMLVAWVWGIATGAQLIAEARE